MRCTIRRRGGVIVLSADELRGEGEVNEDTHRQVHPAAAIAWARLRRAGVLEAAPGMRDRLEAIAGDDHGYRRFFAAHQFAHQGFWAPLPAVARRFSEVVPTTWGDAFV